MRTIDEVGRQIRALEQRLSAYSGRATAIEKFASSQGRDFTQEENARIDKIYADFTAVEGEISVLQNELADLNEKASYATAGRIVPPQAAGSVIAARARPTGRLYDQMFRGAAADPYSGKFETLGEFALAVANGGRDARLDIRNAGMSEGSGVSAGYLVPTQFVRGIIDGALAIEVIRPNCRVLPMAGNELDTAAFDFEDQTSGKRAGLKLAWGPEAGTLSEQVAVARKLSFKACKGNILCRVSNELAEDVLAFDTQLTEAMVAAVGAGLDGVFVSGTGSGQPLGILNAPCLITVTEESNQPANSVWLENLAKMVARLTPASFKRCVWLVHPTVIPKLLTLTVVVTNVAGTENVGGGPASAVVQQSDGSLTIYGRPVLVTDACSALSTAGDIILADLTQYGVGMRRDITIEMSRDVYFTTDELGFKLTLRLDGQPLASAATKLRDGTNTVSPFVALGTRS